MEDNDAVPAKKAKMDDGNDVTESSNLFVGHLSWNIDDEWLASEFRDFEGFIKARVVTHRDNPSHSRGFGYVDFNSLPAARAAMEAMQGKEIDGKTINVDLSTPRSQGSGPQNRSEQRAKTFGDVLSPESNTLFVGNLPFEITRDEVWEFFSQTVEPKNVRLPTDP
jgi:nucleolin